MRLLMETRVVKSRVLETEARILWFQSRCGQGFRERDGSRTQERVIALVQEDLQE